MPLGDNSGGGGFGSFLTGLAGNPLVGLAGGLLSGLLGNSQIEEAQGQVQDLSQFNPFQGNIGGLGSFGFANGRGSLQLDPGLQQSQAGLASILPGLLGGGFSGANDLQQGRQVGGGIGGAAGFAQQQNNQLANPFFNQSSFANNMQNIGGLGNIFANNVAGGPQDFSGGAFGNLLQGGQNNLAQAGNTSGLVQQNLDASRALAQPFEQNLINNFRNSEFSATRGATSGSGTREDNVIRQLGIADNQRIANAQGLGLQNQQQLGQIGLGQLGQAQGFLGQNLGQFNQNVGAAQGFGQLGAGLENQGFLQQLQALGQNQSAGNNRLQNALSIFNTQTGAFNDSVGLGLGGIGQQTGIGELGLQGVLGLLNAEANRIGATQGHAQALGQLGSASGGFLSGLF